MRFPRFRTRDDSIGSIVGGAARGRFYISEQLSEQQALTPEGFLLCLNVPVARIGTQLYGPGETPITVGAGGVVRVARDEDEVFRAEFVHSFMGKPITNEHPSTDVTPDNWRELAVGTVLNPRRGSGMQADLLLADFLITDKDAIADVQAGKREVSCGYDAEYIELTAGHGKQINMVGNHIALVEAGRCGGRCAIGDQLKIVKQGDVEMKVRDEAPKGWLARLKVAVAAKDEATVTALMAEAEDPAHLLPRRGISDASDTHIHIHGTNDEAPPGADPAHVPINDAIDRRFADTDEKIDAIAKDVQTMRETMDAVAEKLDIAKDASEATEELEAEMQDEAGEEVDIKKAKDSALLYNAYQYAVAGAEILAPGIRVSAFDAKARPGKGLDDLCKLRRSALDLAYNQPETRGLIEEINGKPLSTKDMKCGQVRTLFNATVAMTKQVNNQTMRMGDGGRERAGGGMGIKGQVQTIAELNKRNAERYGPKK